MIYKLFMSGKTDEDITQLQHSVHVVSTFWLHTSQSVRGTTSQPTVWMKTTRIGKLTAPLPDASVSAVFTSGIRAAFRIYRPLKLRFLEMLLAPVLVLVWKLHSWDIFFCWGRKNPAFASCRGLISHNMSDHNPSFIICFETTLDLPPRLQSEERNLWSLHKSASIFSSIT